MTEQGQIEFTLDGKAATAGAEETVLNVARRSGIEIPVLCHHAAILPYGACRLCVVEVFWGKRSKIMAACLYTPRDGDRIETGNDRVRRARRVILEFLLARCPEVEAIRVLAREYGAESPRFQTTTSTALDKKCILCGLCVRVCTEAIGQHAIGYANCGVERAVTTPFEEASEACIGCGACVAVCPTGALHMDVGDGELVMRELNTRLPMARCKECGRPFAAARQVAKARSRIPANGDAFDLCPACKRNVLCLNVETNVFAESQKSG